MINCILGERENDILQFFLKNSDKKFTLNDVTKNFSFGISNTRNSLLKIDDFLTSNSFPSLKKKNNLFSVKSSYTNKISTIAESCFSPSVEDRKTYLLFKLLTEEIVSLTEVALFFNLNRKSIQLDLQDIKKFLKEHNLEIISVNSKGVSICGDILSKYYLFIQILIRIFFKRNNPFENNLYSQFCSSDDREEILRIIKVLSEVVPFAFGTGIYYAIFSVFIINRKFSNIFSADKISEAFSNSNLEFPENIITQFKKTDTSEILQSIKILTVLINSHANSNFDFQNEKIDLFIDFLEKKLGNFSSEDTDIIFKILKLADFNKRFSIDISQECLNSLDDSLSNFLREILHEIDFQMPLLDFEKLYFFLKNSPYANHFFCDKATVKRILIIDGSPDNWMGKTLKKYIEHNYYTDEVSIINYLNHYFSPDSETYSLVLKLETPPTFFPDIIEFNLKSFIRNTEYLDSFNLCRKK